MLLGPPDIINCPFCNTFYQIESLISGNTIGGIYYSDGQSFYPMLPDQPQFTVCDSCQNFFWVKDAKSNEDMTENIDLGNIPDIRWPSQEEWIRAISQHMYSNESDEIYLRTHLWWMLNNKYRIMDRIKPNSEPFEEHLYTENLHALLRLKQSEEAPDRLLLAEIHRELGYFDEALDLLKKVTDGELKNITRQIRVKARRKNPFVFKLT